MGHYQITITSDNDPVTYFTPNRQGSMEEANYKARCPNSQFTPQNPWKKQYRPRQNIPSPDLESYTRSLIRPSNIVRNVTWPACKYRSSLVRSGRVKVLIGQIFSGKSFAPLTKSKDARPPILPCVMTRPRYRSSLVRSKGVGVLIGQTFLCNTKASKLVPGSLPHLSHSMWIFARGSLYDMSSRNEVRFATL